MLIIRENKITSKTYEKVKIARAYIEKKYKMKKIQEDEKKKGIFFLLKNKTGN